MAQTHKSEQMLSKQKTIKKKARTHATIHAKKRKTYISLPFKIG